MHGLQLGERVWSGGVLTALAKVENEASLHVGAAHQVLCGLDRVDGLCADFALFGAQPLALVAENAGRTNRWPESWAVGTAQASRQSQGYVPHLLLLRVKPGGH